MVASVWSGDCFPWLEKLLLLPRVTWEPWARHCGTDSSLTASFITGPDGHAWQLEFLSCVAVAVMWF